MDDDILARHLPVIKRHSRLADLSTITPFYDGQDHYAFVVSDELTFRFPRSESHGQKDRVENVFLREFTKVSPVPVQAVEAHTDSETGLRYQVYPFILGVGLTIGLARTVPANQMMSVAASLGRFLKVLHAFPLDRARQMNMDELDPVNYWQWFQGALDRYRQTVFRFLSDREQAWVEARYAAYIELSQRHTFTVKVTHSDLHPEHIIVDANSHALNGVIDFSPRIADPANDFKCFDRFGAAFLREAYAYYAYVDETFDQRRQFYATDLPVNNLYQAIESGDEERINGMRQELSAYIAAWD